MITYEELNSQNHHITELSNILSALLKDRSMCDNGTCCGLFHSYIEQVKQHMDLVDKHLTGKLLSHDDVETRNIVKNFMSGSQEIRRITARYIKDWCPNMKAESLAVANHDRFYKDTEQMFSMVLQRIQDETEKLYPLIRKLSGNMDHAA